MLFGWFIQLIDTPTQALGGHVLLGWFIQLTKDRYKTMLFGWFIQPKRIVD